MEIKNKYIPYSSLPAGKYGYVIPNFRWPHFPSCELWLGFLRLSLAEQNTVILPSSTSSNSITWMKKKEKEKSNFSCVWQGSTTSLSMKDCFISTSLYRLLRLQIKSWGVLSFPKDFCAVTSKGPKVGVVRVCGRSHLTTRQRSMSLLQPLSLLVLSPGCTGNGWRSAAH